MIINRFINKDLKEGSTIQYKNGWMVDIIKTHDSYTLAKIVGKNEYIVAWGINQIIEGENITYEHGQGYYYFNITDAIQTFLNKTGLKEI